MAGSPSAARLRAFVRRETRLSDVPGVPGIRIHQGSDVTTLWHRTAEILGAQDPPLPYWAFAWSGGLALARFLIDQPDVVRGRSVFDLGTGSGLCGIVAARLGAAAVTAVDVDPLAVAAAQLNARANGVELDVQRRDPLDDEPLPVEVILIGDVSYEQRMGERMRAWALRAAGAGSTVFVGDPGRRWFVAGPDAGLEQVARYTVQVSHEIEEAELKESVVYRVVHSATT